MDKAKATLPKSIILTAVGAPMVHDGNRIIYVENDDENIHDALIDVDKDSGEGNLFNPRAKIEVEPEPEPASDYVRFRFCHSDRYLAVEDPKKLIPIATSHNRNNTKSDALSTLFDATVVVAEDNTETVVLKHVGSKLYVQWDEDSLKLTTEYPPRGTPLYFLDYDMIVKLPEHVAFQSPYNKKYLQKMTSESNKLQFSCDDPNDEKAGFWITRRPDGYIRIMDHDGKFWKQEEIIDDYNLIYSNQEADLSLEPECAFWAVKVDNNTIALRSAVNGLFCRRDEKGMKDCLSASSSNVTDEARLKVEELVVHRNIYDVNYMLKGGRTIDEKPYLSGITTVVNRGDKADSVAVEINHQKQEAYTFSRQNSDALGLSTSFKAGVPFITDSGIQVSYERTATFQWDNTTTTTTSVKVTDTVPVPANSKVEVHYVGTVGTCRVPFSYTQHDMMPNGNTRTTKYADGVCTGVNCYNFKFKVKKTESLAPAVDTGTGTGTLLVDLPLNKK